MSGGQDGVFHLGSEVEKSLQDSKSRGRAMLEHKEAYHKLEGRLEQLSDKSRWTVMVPFTSKAFMPGTLVHTNDLLVLLGDNYFREASVKEAKEICQRRIEQCDKVLLDIEKEMKLVQGWKDETKKFKDDTDGTVDIREEYDQEKEEEWKKRHRQLVREEKLREKETREQSADEGRSEQTNPSADEDDQLWQRLEELEIMEALEMELESKTEPIDVDAMLQYETQIQTDSLSNVTNEDGASTSREESTAASDPSHPTGQPTTSKEPVNGDKVLEDQDVKTSQEEDGIQVEPDSDSSPNGSSGRSKRRVSWVVGTENLTKGSSVDQLDTVCDSAAVIFFVNTPDDLDDIDVHDRPVLVAAPYPQTPSDIGLPHHDPEVKPVKSILKKSQSAPSMSLPNADAAQIMPSQSFDEATAANTEANRGQSKVAVRRKHMMNVLDPSFSPWSKWMSGIPMDKEQMDLAIANRDSFVREPFISPVAETVVEKVEQPVCEKPSDPSPGCPPPAPDDQPLGHVRKISRFRTMRLKE